MANTLYYILQGIFERTKYNVRNSEISLGEHCRQYRRQYNTKLSIFCNFTQKCAEFANFSIE